MLVNGAHRFKLLMCALVDVHAYSACCMCMLYTYVTIHDYRLSMLFCFCVCSIDDSFCLFNWCFFVYLSYALDINMDRAEDVLLHHKLLTLAKNSENRLVFHVRFIEVLLSIWSIFFTKYSFVSRWNMMNNMVKVIEKKT